MTAANWGNLKSEFRVLFGSALAIKRETRLLRGSVRLLLSRRPLDEIGARIDALSESFYDADAKLIAAGYLDGGINSLIMESASCTMVASGRESVRMLLREAYADLNDVRARLNNAATLALSVAATLVGIVALFAGG